MKDTTLLEKCLIGFAFLGVTVGAVLSYVSPDYFRNVYVVEDGFTEMTTVAALLAAFAVCVRRFVILWGHKPARFMTMVGLLTLFCLFGAGEELSWGQRIFDFESPEFFQEHNAQQETGLHNLAVEIDGKRYKVNRIIFGTGLAIAVFIYLAIMTPLYRRKPRFREFVDSFAIPMPQNYQVFSYLLVLIVAELLVDSTKRGEITEFGGSIVFMLNVVFPYNASIFQPQQTPR
jgi:cell division protein FtsW (lipid II flippase)